MNLGILTVCSTCAGASRPMIKRPVDIGKILAGLQHKIKTHSAPATVRLYGQTIRIPRFIISLGGLWTAGFRALPETVRAQGLMCNCLSHEKERFSPWVYYHKLTGLATWKD